MIFASRKTRPAILNPPRLSPPSPFGSSSMQRFSLPFVLTFLLFAVGLTGCGTPGAWCSGHPYRASKCCKSAAPGLPVPPVMSAPMEAYPVPAPETLPGPALEIIRPQQSGTVIP